MTAFRDLSPRARALAERIFIAREQRRALRAGRDTEVARPISFSRLYRYIVEATPAVDPEIDAALARDSRLAAAQARLVRNRAVYSAPMAAAAADRGSIEQRHGNGWQLRLVPVRGAPDQRWVVISFDRADAEAPNILYAGALRQRLPEMANRQIQFRIGADSAMARALVDTATELYLL